MRLLVVELKLKGQMQSETGGVLMGNMQAKVRWEQNDEWAADMWAFQPRALSQSRGNTRSAHSHASHPTCHWLDDTSGSSAVSWRHHCFLLEVRDLSRGIKSSA